MNNNNFIKSLFKFAILFIVICSITECIKISLAQTPIPVIKPFCYCGDFNEKEEVAIAFVVFTLKNNTEGFIETPKWDNHQWTWGYGTRVGDEAGFGTYMKGDDELDTPEKIEEASLFIEQYITRKEALFTLYEIAIRETKKLNNYFGNRWLELPLANQVAYLDISYNEGYFAFTKSKVARMIKDRVPQKDILKEIQNGYSKNKGVQRRIELRVDLLKGKIKL